MNIPFKAIPQDQSAIVYVRPVTVADLPEELREQIGDVETVYSVHRPDGERLALVRDRSMAFSLARQHDLAPVSAH
ncbi:MAG: DUF1150 family protein [Paracoccaceae bacterium]